MIGDRSHDIVGAKNNGMKGIGVLYGYGSRDELLQAGAQPSLRARRGRFWAAFPASCGLSPRNFARNSEGRR